MNGDTKINLCNKKMPKKCKKGHTETCRKEEKGFGILVSVQKLMRVKKIREQGAEFSVNE